jgi:two-component system sensor histidine kinase CpxA
MDEMIGQLLTLAKINTSQQVVNLQKVSLHQLLGKVLQDAKFEAEALHKTLTVGRIPDIYVYADSTLLISAIENILRNAIRFATSEVLCAFFLSDVECDLSAKKTKINKCIRLSISDDGQGMKAEEIVKVFDPFFRGKHQVQEISQGAGLGLSIAKAAIELHGGTIFAQARSSQTLTTISTTESSTQEP